MINVFQILEESAEQYSDRVALVDDLGEITFAELLELTCEVKQQLQDLGITPGVGVGIQAPNGRDFVAVLFAVAACEAVAVPFGEGMTYGEIQGFVQDLPVSGIVSCVHTDLSGLGEPLSFQAGKTNFSYVRVGNSPKPFAPHVSGAVFVRPTSGTTGKSKGVVFSHQTVRERIAIAQESLQLGTEDSVIWVLPMAYHFVVSIVLYVQTGTKIVVCQDHLAETVLDATNRHRGTVLYAAPTHYALLAHNDSGKNLSTIRWAICTSGGIALSVAHLFQDRYEVPLRQVYGIIEVGLPVGNLQYPPASVESIGRPLKGFEAALLDENRQLCPPGEVGELALRGPGMFDAYLHPAEGRESKLEDGWFLTGDLATIDRDGTIQIAGRKKSVIIVAGNKVFPEEVEYALNEHPSIEVSRVFGAEHPFVGEVVAAEVVVQKADELSADEIRKFCRGKLSSFKTPQEIKFVNAVNMTASGKVVRH
jgi:acyl-CoA synthetase (AMP-forming)/AMP-acid ligase II